MAISISAIIPTFNRKAIISAAIDSVYSQTMAPSEVIVIDDGSTDGTVDFVRSRYPQVRCLYQPNAGVSAARNAGIQLATGEWLAFLDSDDQWLPQKLAKQGRAIQLYPRYGLCHTDEIWIRHGIRVNPKLKHRKRGGHIYQHCLPLCAISPSSTLIRRDLLVALGMFDPALPACEDYDLWLRYCAKHPVLYLDEPLLIKFGGHADQLSSKYWGMDRFRLKALEKQLQNPQLSADNRRATLQMMQKKLNILHTGAVKHGNQPLVGECAALRKRFGLIDTAPVTA